MSEQYCVPVKHDHRDLGFKYCLTDRTVHYWRTNEHSSLAMSHCALISQKVRLVDAGESLLCPECEMIEDMREKEERPPQSKLP